MNRSEISNDFNFDNQLDITQNRKDRTQQYFSKDGFAFQDFMNIGGDPTNKSIDKISSKYNNNTSEIFKKQQDSAFNPVLANNNIIDYLTQHSIRGKRKEPTFLSNLSHSDPPDPIIAPSPKFAQELIRGTTKTIQESPKRQFTLRRTETVAVDRHDRHPSDLQVSRSTKMEHQKSMKTSEAFKKKPTAGERLKQQEYRQLENQVHFYEDSLARMIYQSQRMQEESESLLGAFNSAAHEAEIEAAARDIKTINAQIEEERNLQLQLAKMIANLQEEYEQLVSSIKASNFPRPVRIKDDAKAIVDQINALKAQFEALERDEGSLNLSSTLVPNNNASLQAGNTFRPYREENGAGVARIQEIYLQNKRSEDPRFLQNIKMACLRDEWNLYSNGQLQVHLSYRHCPRVRITIGNKIARDLQKFSLIQDGVSRLQGETVAARSYIVHEVEVTEEGIDQMFIKCELSYQLDADRRVVTLFIPTGITTFGEFSPVTAKQFTADAGGQDFQYCAGFRPLDKKLVTDVTEIERYMSNLLVDRDNYKCSGMFISLFNAFTFLQIRQKGELLSVAAKTPDWPLIRLLQFIFTL